MRLSSREVAATMVPSRKRTGPFMTAPLFASSLSTAADTEEAIRETVRAISRGLEGRSPDLLLCFVSHHHGAALSDLGTQLRDATGATRLLGCTGERIVGQERETGQEPALSLWAMSSPESQITPIDITASQSTGNSIEFDAYPAVEGKKNPFLILIGEPFSFPMAPYLAELNQRAPGLLAIGGMASGGLGAGQNLLFTEDRTQHEGAIGVVVEGGVELEPVVSQGCRPVGRAHVVTKAEGNLIVTLGGKPAARVLHSTLAEIPEADQELLRNGPALGVAHDPTKSLFERGDFLLRGILGHRPEDDALAIADTNLRVGMTVQFLVRDAASAGEDLTLMMKAGAEHCDPNSVGALVFSCNGRGPKMFGCENHDISCVQSAFEDHIPAAGFFAMGEIGPVGKQNFLHGFTASVGLVRQATDE